MALAFGLFQGATSPSFISGPQFEQDPTNVKIISLIFVGTGVETIYTVPVGKTLFITKVIMSNFDASAKAWNWQINDVAVYGATVLSGEAKEVDFPSPLPINAGGTFKAQSNDAGAYITLLGWEV